MDRIDRLACPRCGGALGQDAGTWRCAGCGSSYRGLRGIPDLRTADDGYLTNEADWAFARRLDEGYDRLDFRGLLARYFELAADVPAAMRRRQVAHILSAPDRARQWLEALGPVAARGPILDLGCGPGSFLAAVAGAGRECWGVDIALRWLLVARKRLDEEGLGHVRLVCGCAERLPLRDGGFAAVVGGDVIEHVADQAATLAEAHRVLRPGGRLFLATPNRFSLAPEPHVGVWGVGFLPRRWMAPYVRFVAGRDFRAIRTLGIVGWTRILERIGFGSWRIDVPGLPPGELEQFGPMKRALARAYNRAIGGSVGRAAAGAVGPLFHVTATRGAEGAEARPASRATRRRSRRSARPG